MLANAGASRFPLRRFALLLLAWGTVPAPPVPAANVTVTLHAPDTVRVGERVRFRLRVTNATSRAIDLYLRGRSPTFDVTITTARGDTVWRRLEGEIIPAMVQLRALAAGAFFELTAEWNQRTAAGAALPPATYTVRASLLGEATSIEAPPTSLSVVAR